MKNAWGKRISGAHGTKTLEYVKMRVRIGLRESGLDPDTDPGRVNRETDILFRCKKGEKKGLQVTQETVIKALSAGEEVSFLFLFNPSLMKFQHLNILEVRCVAYDQAFDNDFRSTLR